MECLNSILIFFKQLDGGIVNAATVISAIFGILFSIFAFFYSIHLSQSSERLQTKANELAEATKINTEAVQKQNEAIHKYTRGLRIDNLRNLYELSKANESENAYWTFRWRFETLDNFGVIIREIDSGDSLGHCYLKVTGFSNPPDKIDLESRASEFYVVKVREISASSVFAFNDGELAACFMQNDKIILSRGIDPWTSEKKFEIIIGTLGAPRAEFGERTAESAVIYPRIKDHS